MSRHHLRGCTILIVEDEPLIVLDITTTFEHTGAHLTTTNTVKHARILVEHDGLSAAILDHALPDGDTTNLCTRLTERGIPYLIYSGYPPQEGPCKGAPHLTKPAMPNDLLDAMEALIKGAQISG
jgi:DNA-binding response OmpR family regulator